MAQYFVDALRNIEEWGLSDVLLPFLLVFTIIFAILQKTNVLGKEKRNWNTIVAMVIALLFVVPHIMGTYPGNSDPVEIVNKALPNVSIVIIAIVMFLILIGLMGGDVSWPGGSRISGIVAIAALIFIIAIFGHASGWWITWPRWLWWLEDSQTQALVIVILVFGIIIWFITKDEKKEGPRMKMLSDIGDFFKGKG
ncbi:MAG: hypothetical protein ABIF10_01450 [Candidatus Woesearchaeota archaeon]